MNKSRPLKLAIWLIMVLSLASIAHPAAAAKRNIRVATFNTSLYRDRAGQLIRDLETGGNQQARRIAEIIQHLKPDVVFLNEFDYDEAGTAVRLFREKYLALPQGNEEEILFDHYFIGPVNTGVQSGRDLDHNGTLGNPADAIGFGRHPGQYGMLVLSKFPIDTAAVRTFQKFLWRDMPNPRLPVVPKTSKPFYDDDDLNVQRLSSKSFWDVPIKVPALGTAQPFTLHLLGSHPTPPVFDGPEDRNGCRNHDEIRLVADYISPQAGQYLVDDKGQGGGLAADAEFIVVGDLNCDPVDGDSVPGTMNQLLQHPRVNAAFTPLSEGGPLTVKKFPDQFTKSRGNPAHVTSNFTAEGHGCLRIDYVLPSRGLEVAAGGVYWPKPGEPGAEAVQATDHRPVWLDVRPGHKVTQ
jgi:3-phytase/alkaline phosphatase D